MFAFHLVFDLQMFGHLPHGITATPFFYWHARIVAGSFLFLAGFSLWLAHGTGLRWPAFRRRWLRVAGAAALVSLATRLALPDYWVFFGILHCIAVSSLLGLAFLRLPFPVTALAGVVVMAGSYILPDPAFNAPWLRFLGLHKVDTFTVDFEPLFPWFGPFLLGMACAQALGRHGKLPLLALPDRPLTRALVWPGQHSLAIYLAHQPVLLALIWVVTQAMALR